MSVSISNPALLRAILTGVVVFAGTACSRSDRTESGRDNSAAVLSDTNTAPPQPSPSSEPNTPRAETAPAERDAAGYRSMKRDTTNPGQHSDSARITADTADASVSSDTSVSQISPPADTAAAGYAEMVRDTSTIADQLDTLAVSDTADGGRSGAVLAAGVTGAAVAAASRDGDARDNAGGVTSPEAQNETGGQVTESTSTAVSDTAGTLQARVDTSHHAEASDSGRAGAVLAAGAAGAAVAEPGSAADQADITESERVRPPQDSTELLGNVNSSETADEEPVTASEQETVSASRTDAVGAAAMGGTLTGAEAVGLMTRQGTQCTVVDPESDEEVRWDMASTPVTLNPCGMGSMVLSKISTGVE